MKETIRTASVCESFSEAERLTLEKIEALTKEIQIVDKAEYDEKSNNVKAKALSASQVFLWFIGRSLLAGVIGGCVIGIIGIITNAWGLAAFLAIVSMIVFIVSSVVKLQNDFKQIPTTNTNPEVYNERRSKLNTEIQSLEVDLTELRAKKRAILIGEVIEASVMVNEAVGKPAAQIPSPQDAQQITGEKTCPMCAETVKAAARKCKHCGHLFE